MENTTLFSINEMKDHLIKETLKEVADSLKERGYNATNQLVGYIISGDPGFISNYKDARNHIEQLDRSEIIKFLLESYLEK